VSLPSRSRSATRPGACGSLEGPLAEPPIDLAGTPVRGFLEGIEGMIECTHQACLVYRLDGRYHHRNETLKQP
jgi:hypothetical protein